MAAEGEAKNPSGGGGGGGGGGGDNPQVAAAPAPAEGEAVQEALAQGTGQEHEAEKADREGEKDDGACRDLVLVEDPEAVAVEDPEEGTVAIPAEPLSSGNIIGRSTRLLIPAVAASVSAVRCIDTVVLVLDVFRFTGTVAEKQKETKIFFLGAGNFFCH
jgi:hypothetical protein